MGLHKRKESLILGRGEGGGQKDGNSNPNVPPIPSIIIFYTTFPSGKFYSSPSLHGRSTSVTNDLYL